MLYILSVKNYENYDNYHAIYIIFFTQDLECHVFGKPFKKKKSLLLFLMHI